MRYMLAARLLRSWVSFVDWWSCFDMLKLCKYMLYLVLLGWKVNSITWYCRGGGESHLLHCTIACTSATLPWYSYLSTSILLTLQGKLLSPEKIILAPISYTLGVLFYQALYDSKQFLCWHFMRYWCTVLTRHVYWSSFSITFTILFYADLLFDIFKIHLFYLIHFS